MTLKFCLNKWATGQKQEIISLLPGSSLFVSSGKYILTLNLMGVHSQK